MTPAKTPKKRRTPAQKKAYDALKFALAQEERFMGSVFVNAHGQRQHEERVKAAYAECHRLGVVQDL